MEKEKIMRADTIVGGGAGGQLFYNDSDYPPYLQQFHFHDQLASFCTPQVNRELCACLSTALKLGPPAANQADLPPGPQRDITYRE